MADGTHRSEDDALEPVGAQQIYRGNVDRLVGKVRDERGLDLSNYREHYVERRIATRLRALRLHSYRQYADYLDAHPDEYSRLIDTLTINVTDFYRDAPVFDLFRRQIVPDMIEAKLASRQRMIRCWSAGCATGEEPYSMIMSFLSGIEKSGQPFKLSVTGTDLDEDALRVARKGEYPLEKLKNIPSSHRLRYLDIGEETFRVKQEVRRCARFNRLNLFSDKPMNIVDVIFCRNVFIYFSREQQERALSVFLGALARGGHLVLGRSERLAPNMAKRFELVNGRERIYRKPREV
jgi:chemotaxis methyl-accepting protein methylase